jgi:2-dehydro-3-deoxyphosphogluconate aldolase/(4S)-4-hydroxy-2-oxoglutarate aldolase
MDLNRFAKKRVLGILRGVEAGSIEPLTDAVIEAGLEAIEITMNTKGATGLIDKMARRAKGRISVGAGTVLDVNSAEEAIGAGATFIVLPVLVEDVVSLCVKKRIPVFPGALTPQEVYNAWNAGATMVKVFPVSLFGPGYFRELKGPFNDIKLLACGGVTPENMKDYFDAGACAVAFGASVFSKERLAKNDFAGIKCAVRKFLDNVSF